MTEPTPLTEAEALVRRTEEMIDWEPKWLAVLRSLVAYTKTLEAERDRYKFDAENLVESTERAEATLAKVRALVVKESDEIRTRYEPDGPYTGYANACDDVLAILDASAVSEAPAPTEPDPFTDIPEPSERFLSDYLFPFFDEIAQEHELNSDQIAADLQRVLRPSVLDEYRSWITESWEPVESEAQ